MENYKNKLQEKIQEIGGELPNYETIQVTDSTNIIWRSKVSFKPKGYDLLQQFYSINQKTKKAAEQDAAKRAFEYIFDNKEIKEEKNIDGSITNQNTNESNINIHFESLNIELMNEENPTDIIFNCDMIHHKFYDNNIKESYKKFVSEIEIDNKNFNEYITLKIEEISHELKLLNLVVRHGFTTKMYDVGIEICHQKLDKLLRKKKMYTFVFDLIADNNFDDNIKIMHITFHKFSKNQNTQYNIPKIIKFIYYTFVMWSLILEDKDYCLFISSQFDDTFLKIVGRQLMKKYIKEGKTKTTTKYFGS